MNPSAESTPVLRPVPDEPARDPAWNGITKPRSAGGRTRFLTDVIVELGLVDRDRVAQAVDAARVAGTTPEKILMESGVLSAESLSKAIAERHGLDHLDLNVFKPDMTAANMITGTAAKRYQAVPVELLRDNGLLVAVADPSDLHALDDIAMLTGMDLKVAVASSDDIAALISRMTRLDDVVASTALEAAEEESAEIVDLRESADDAPVIKLVNQIIAEAVEHGASDVHLSPDGHHLRVRFRIDGVLTDTTTVPRRMVAGVISRVKIMSDLDIAERRVPQDGRVGLTIDGHSVDLRVVTLPSVHGESIVMRILDKGSVVQSLDMLGMGEEEHRRFRRAFSQAYGAVLVTGPTGSGKSTTLYGALQVINTPEKNIITIEDPVEYQIEGITQIQTNSKAGLTFATGLRSMMRADPDVIMVGEIRDRETAQIAVESALTGHLVLSTLHTNDAPSAITRLIEMGIEPFLVSSAVDCVVAQRLARKLCNHCKSRAIIATDALAESGFNSRVDVEAYEPGGCGRCGGSGYKGRVGLYEVMILTEEIRHLVIERAPADRIAEIAMRDGMRRLRDDGFDKVKQGITSIAEVARVIGSGSSA